jgi:hypothetical protein
MFKKILLLGFVSVNTWSMDYSTQEMSPPSILAFINEKLNNDPKAFEALDEKQKNNIQCCILKLIIRFDQDFQCFKEDFSPEHQLFEGICKYRSLIAKIDQALIEEAIACIKKYSEKLPDPYWISSQKDHFIEKDQFASVRKQFLQFLESNYKSAITEGFFISQQGKKFSTQAFYFF